MTTETQVFQIRSARFDEARTAMAKFTKKAQRYGVPFSATFGPAYSEGEWRRCNRNHPKAEARHGSYYRWVETVWHDVTITGEKPIVGNYEFKASIEIGGPAGNFVDTVPGFDAQAYHFTDNRCEHCHFDRARKHVFIVQEADTGRLVQVGRTCLRDFLGTDDPRWIIKKFQFLRELRELFGGEDGFRSYGGWSEDIAFLLAHTTAAIRLWGWMSRSAAKLDESAWSTMDRVWCVYETKKYTDDGHVRETWEVKEKILAEVRDSDWQLAAEVVEWVRQSTDTSDYFHNLRVAYSEDVLYDTKRAALAISAVAAFHREQERELQLARRKEQNAQSEWQGAVGERLRSLVLRVEQVRHMGSNTWGDTVLVKLRDAENNVFTWFTGAGTGCDVGDEVLVTGTVKAHKEYNGNKETQLTRCKLEIASRTAA